MNRAVSRRPFLQAAAAAGLGVVAAPAIIGRVQAAPMQLKLSSSQADDPKFANGRVVYDALNRQLQKTGLNEQIQISFFPNNQLGQEIDVINSVKLGVVDMMVSAPSISANLVPLVGVLDLGYLFQSYQQQTRAFEAGAGKLIEDALLKGANVRVVGWAYDFGARSILARKAVHGPADLTGLKIRTLPNPVITDCLRLMGAAATPLAMGEIYTALQAGVLDGMEHNPPTIVAGKYYETAKFFSHTEHIFASLATYLSNITFNRMDPKLREGFLAVGHDAAIDVRARALAAVGDAEGVLRQNGVTIITDVDRDAFRKRVAVQTDNFVKAHPEAKPIVDLIHSTPA
jgi:TRAP-type C4-dicarboxylate transport system substrate-binding protein